MHDPRIAEAENIRLAGHSDLGGHGDGMTISLKDHYAFVGHVGASRVGTSIVDISRPEHPRVVRQILTPEGTHSHKTQIVGDVLIVNHERNTHEPATDTWSAGIKTYDISDPENPQELGFMPVEGKGVHRMTFVDPEYAYMSATDFGIVGDFFLIADVSDPSNPHEVGRWWFPGQHMMKGEVPSWDGATRSFRHHHPGIRDDRAYAPWWDAGLVILDISDRTKPSMVSWLDFGKDESGATHTAVPVPGRELLLVCDESLKPYCREVPKLVRVVDISDEAHPEVVSTFPVPVGDYATRPGRFGPHNIHDMRPGSFSSSRIAHVTYFNAGLRVYDFGTPEEPREIAHFLPEPLTSGQVVSLNDLYVSADGTMYVTDRFGGGMWILQPDSDELLAT